MRVGGESVAVRTLLIAALLTGGCGRGTLPRSASATPESTPGAARLASNPRALLVQAITLLERGDDDGARARFVVLLESHPALQDYYLAYLAELAERGHRLDEAARLDDRLIATYPESVWIPRALARRARVALALGDPRAAEFAARTLTAAGSDKESRGYALLVQADVRAPDAPEAAYALYQEVRKLRGSAAGLAREHASALERAAPRLLEDANLLLGEGRVLMLEGRLDLAAIRLAAAAAASDPGNRSEPLRALARTRQLQGRIDEAIATYREAADDEGSKGMATFDLASLLWNRDRDDEARALFERLLRDAPAHPKRDAIRYALGRIAQQNGESAAALAQYQRLVAETRDADLARDARWQIAWIPYRAARFSEAAQAFAELARTSEADRAAGLYWQARAYERAGDAEAAARTYDDVLADAPETYYGELSERRIGVTAPPPPPATPLAGDPPPSLTLHSYHWDRSEELRGAGLERLAATELDALARELPGDGETEPYLLEAYRRVDAPSRALRFAARLEKTGAVPAATLAAYLYPRAYWPLVRDEAGMRRLDPYLVLALMRQESSFDPNAASPAAAFGLMQLVGRTASRVAGTEVRPHELADPATNIRLGTAYLRELLDRYDGSTAKALAAYNAGEEAVAKWERRTPEGDLDEFVESISYRETLRYVKVVLGNYRRYRRLYGAPGELRALDDEAPVRTDPATARDRD